MSEMPLFGLPNSSRRALGQVEPEVVSLLAQSDEAERQGFHSGNEIAQGEFVDSTRDLLLGVSVDSTDDAAMARATEIVAAQELQHSQLQVDISGLKHRLESDALTPDQRSELVGKLQVMERRASRIAAFLQEAKRRIGPVH